MNKELNISLSYTFLTNAEIDKLSKDESISVSWSVSSLGSIKSNIEQGNYNDCYLLDIDGSKYICIAIIENNMNKICRLVIVNLNNDALVEGEPKTLALFLSKIINKG